MISPPRWNLKRPGVVFPVFFLCLIQAWGQIAWQEAQVTALGDAFVSRSGNFSACHNQAGLGWIEEHSLSLQHTRPFILKELGVSILSVQVSTGKGALGITLSSFGLTGLRQTAIWISYGMQLKPGITAGVGIHGWSHHTAEQLLYGPWISCAMGIQARMGERVVMGIHVLHPVGWETHTPGSRQRPMVLTAGFACTLFQFITYQTDLQIMPDRYIKICHGMELNIGEQIQLQMGMHNRPFSVSGGLALIRAHWIICVAFEYMLDSGSTPSSSISYAW